MNTRELYEKPKNIILESLDRGVAPWRQPWGKNGLSLAQRNAFTNRPYRGINVFTLMLAGRGDNRWATYKQIKKNGGNVVRGSKSQFVIFWKFVPVRKSDDLDEDQRETYPILKYFRVFNVEDTTGLDLPADPTSAPAEIPSNEIAEKITNQYAKSIGLVNRATGTGPVVRFGGGRAYYSPAMDNIQMPPVAAFNGTGEFYSTLFHEFGHSTGHHSRLNRFEKNAPGDKFGSHGYGLEELVAEFTSAFLCSEATVDPGVIENQASYIHGWKRAIKADHKLVVMAAARAQKAADMVLGQQWNKS